MATSKAYISTYSYDLEAAFHSSSGESIDIMKETIHYIMVNHDYLNALMPVIYMRVRLFPSTYNKMVPDQGKGKLYLRINRIQKLGAVSSTPKKVISEEFDYYMTDDPNTYKQLDTIGEPSGTAYKTCFIGLLKLDLQKKNRKIFENIYKNTNSMSLVQMATSHMKMVIQPFTNNKNFQTFICPTITSIGQFLSYLNAEASFYKGAYTYYMDFEKTYLRSNDGAYIDAKDGDFKYIAIDIRDLTLRQSLSTGMVEDPDQDAYIVYVSGSDVKIIIDRVTSSLIGTISGIDATDGDKTESNVNTQSITNISTADSTAMYVTIDKKAAKNLTTRVAESSDTLVITKIDMDSRVFTLNKKYLLANYEDNPKYCGVYYLIKKQETYLRTGEQLTCQVTLTLKKCADFV